MLTYQSVLLTKQKIHANIYKSAAVSRQWFLWQWIQKLW